MRLGRTADAVAAFRRAVAFDPGTGQQQAIWPSRWRKKAGGKKRPPGRGRPCGWTILAFRNHNQPALPAAHEK
jgi:hypothetical protein